ncbi:DUF4492 domain-containing protein [Marinifilum caeruleilacunae]|uniref:DUF4492 domain-containing protein n=1 Tax=Marinifilum caeruleilacunae TaxID=2499076 RepID=A0ABX1WS31_9BACT|nr:DUF4492 domain-containing protein [Marinifilum caeruleilacunae]NOU58733.1 DUF4492 domain-containing protein [Marinifilum caeruleilacunae]
MKPLIILRKIWFFYYEGFVHQKEWSRQVWFIIILKLFIMFFILKFFFFPNFLKSKYSNDKDRGDYVIEQLTNPK